MENATNETVRNNFAMVDSKTKETLVRKMTENALVHHSIKPAEHNFRKKKILYILSMATLPNGSIFKLQIL